MSSHGITPPSSRDTALRLPPDPPAAMPGLSPAQASQPVGRVAWPERRTDASRSFMPTVLAAVPAASLVEAGTSDSWISTIRSTVAASGPCRRSLSSLSLHETGDKDGKRRGAAVVLAFAHRTEPGSAATGCVAVWTWSVRCVPAALHMTPHLAPQEAWRLGASFSSHCLGRYVVVWRSCWNSDAISQYCRRVTAALTPPAKLDA